MIIKKNSNFSGKKYSLIGVFFICGLLIVSLVKNNTRDLQKEISNLKALGIPDYTPHTDTPIQTLEQLKLDLTQKDKDEDEKDDDDSTPVIEDLYAATETLKDRDETDIFDLWDRIKSNQAKRSMLVEKGIIQENVEMPQTKEAMMLNSGGLANLFRVKTQ